MVGVGVGRRRARQTRGLRRRRSILDRIGSAQRCAAAATAADLIKGGSLLPRNCQGRVKLTTSRDFASDLNTSSPVI